MNSDACATEGGETTATAAGASTVNTAWRRDRAALRVGRAVSDVAEGKQMAARRSAATDRIGSGAGKGAGHRGLCLVAVCAWNLGAR